LDYDEITALGDTGGYAGLAILANNSAVLILSVCNLLRREWFWFTSTSPYDEDEYDEICAMIAQLESDIMTSAVGTVLPWAASDLPGWGLLCDGTVYLKVDYPELWDALGDDWEESGTEFVVPDLVDRVVVGSGSRYDLAEKGGEDEHAQTIAEMAPHRHSYLIPVSQVILQGELVPASVRAVGTVSPETGWAGLGNPMSLMQPYQAMKHVIVSGRFTDHGA
jgi:microcystin-dependent protein